MNHRKQEPNSGKKSQSPQSKAEEGSFNNNQKKFNPQSSGKMVIQSKFYVNEYMKTIVKEKGALGEYLHFMPRKNYNIKEECTQASR